ncbi:MAG: hypothetical protein F7C35_06655 [Desulfurococcales archaeon]|nr:hypothetical protein [Desulfurococcales archaeon]
MLTSREARRFYAGFATLSGIVGLVAGLFGLVTYAFFGIGLSVLGFGFFSTLLSIIAQSLVAYTIMLAATAGTTIAAIPLLATGHPYLAATAILAIPACTAYYAYQNVPPVWGNFP